METHLPGPPPLVLRAPSAEVNPALKAENVLGKGIEAARGNERGGRKENDHNLAGPARLRPQIALAFK